MGTRGATLVEVMVAAVLLAVGLGAAAASARAAGELAAGGSRRSAAADAAASALDSVSLSCADGQREAPSGIRVAWRLGAGGPWRSVDVVVTWPAGGGRDTLRVSGVAWCPS
jgi:type II secretory pathway pseudopilin PulG